MFTLIRCTIGIQTTKSVTDEPTQKWGMVERLVSHSTREDLISYGDNDLLSELCE